jgi:serine/threonine protein kinase
VSLVAGQSVGSYRVSSRLGIGGMGEVWRATDTRLGRDVALKVLPPGLADDPERHARFEREARALAALNHPNIAMLYDLEHLDGRHVLVMELVDGEDLAQRLVRGPIPVDEAIAIARQIAEALEAAHEKGIVHRDLKPANVKVGADGQVKVLDFGLAKSVVATAPGSGVGLQDSPTITHAATQAGLLLGTAGYMAPEQARGKPVDGRTDVWALGVVLFEMLTGRPLFEGETVSDTLAAVLRQEIDWNRLPAETPGGVRRVLRRCLERDVRNRFHEIADVRIELEQVLREAPEEAAATAIAAGRGRVPARERLAWLVAAVGVVAAVVALGLALRTSPVASQPTTRFRMLPAATGAIEGYPALSPEAGRSSTWC